MIWSDVQLETLERDWLAGETATVIGQKVGASASAVRSKRLKMGLPERTDEVVAELLAHRGRYSGKGGGAPRAMAAADKLGPLPGSSPKVWTDRVDGRECPFPVGGAGADTLSCCLPVVGRYCLGHTAIRTAA